MSSSLTEPVDGIKPMSDFKTDVFPAPLQPISVVIFLASAISLSDKPPLVLLLFIKLSLDKLASIELCFCKFEFVELSTGKLPPCKMFSDK